MKLKPLVVAAAVLAAATVTFAQTQFVARLAGENVVPPVETEASGVALFTLAEDEGLLRWELHVFDIENVAAAHIHVGSEGANGPVLFGLASGPFSNPASGEISLEPEDVADLLSGGLYVQVHTEQNPPGEIRGQILEEPFHGETSLTAQRLSPRNQVPAIMDSEARALSTIAFDVVRDRDGDVLAARTHFLVGYDFPHATTFVGMHIHEGSAGQNGGVVVNSGLARVADPDGRGTLAFTVAATSISQLDTISSIVDGPDAFYLNIHTAARPAGALRAQIGNVRTSLGSAPGSSENALESPGIQLTRPRFELPSKLRAR